MLTATLERLGGPGRNAAGVLRELVEERDPATAPSQSALEDDLPRVLGRGGLPAPVRQYEVAGVRLDAAYLEIRLGRFDVQRNSDTAKLLLARGPQVLQLTPGDIRRKPSEVVDSGAREVALACLA